MMTNTLCPKKVPLCGNLYLCQN